MLREQQPHELANAALERSQSEKIRDEAELLNIRNLEHNKKQSKMKMYAGTRHSRFGGTFIVQSMKSIGEHELVYHKPLNKVESLSFDGGKSKKKTPKNRMPLVSNEVNRRSAFTIRLFLKEFCIEFLNGAYNTMMLYVKGTLVRTGDDVHDESYYFWAITFFMAFNRSYKFEIKLVSETLSVQTFHYVQQQSENYFDRIRTDRKKLIVWSRRLLTALLSYKELFLTLLTMDKSSDSSIKESSKVIKSNLFYVPEYREFILTLLIQYDELKMSDAYLRDLIETQHLFMKMFEVYCTEEGSIVIQKKTKSHGKKKKKNQPINEEAKLNNLNNLWDKAAPQLSAVLESDRNFLTEEVPFDAASDTPIDEQQSQAMKKIKLKLMQSEFETAISLMRASREVWPENNYFGSENMATEEEFLAIREIFFADLGEEIPNTNNTVTEDEDEDDSDGDNEPQVRTREVNLSFKELVGRLAHPKVIRACGIALRSFDTNSINTNHAIIKLLHRIAFDCKMYVMIFQVSIFRTFQRIFELKDLPQHRELVKFCIYIVRQFVKVIGQNDKIFIECLFWKTKKEAYEIEHGYGASEPKAVGAAWKEEEEVEIRELFQEHKEQNIQEDVVDWMIKNMVNSMRSRRVVLKKLREMDLVEDYKRQYKKTRSTAWSTENEEQLADLYETHKNSTDPVGSIMNELFPKRSKNKVIEKLLSLGLIRDRKEVRKKRSKKSNQMEEKSDFIDTDSDSDAPPIPNKQIKKRTFTVSTNTNETIKLIKQLINSGKQNGIEWLKESISDVIEDFEEDNESVPLVPLSEDIENCMDDQEFQKLLRDLGISEPFDEQESYWRIPEGIGLETLKNHHELLTNALNNDNGCIENGIETENNRDDHDDDVIRREEIQNNKEDEDDDDDDDGLIIDETVENDDQISDRVELAESNSNGEIYLNTTTKRNRIPSESPPHKRIRIEDKIEDETDEL